MSVKLHCVACERFIKDLSEAEVKKITGKELCVDCAEKYKEVYSGLDKAVVDYKKDMEAVYSEFAREFSRVQKFKEQNMSQINTIFTNAKSEIDRIVRKIFKKEE